VLYRSRCKITEVGHIDILYPAVRNLESNKTADEKTDDVSAGEVGDDDNVTGSYFICYYEMDQFYFLQSPFPLGKVAEYRPVSSFVHRGFRAVW
jgi:hypothetical protein